MKFYALLAVLTVLLVGIVLLQPKVKTGQNGSSTPLQSLNSMVGKSAPDITLADQNGATFSLSAHRGHTVVLFFNEGIMCYPACWNQMAALGTDKDLNNGQVVSASVVVDDPSDWGSAFRKMPDLGKGSILFDSMGLASEQYGMLNLPSSMHKGMKPGHTYVIVDASGIVRYVQDDARMGIQNKKLIEEVKKL